MSKAPEVGDQAPFRYSRHLDVLIALVTYLALTERRSRTAANLAVDLSLPPSEVQEAFDEFPGIFRRSTRGDSDGNPFYTIHARYALRPRGGSTDEADLDLPEVRTEILRGLLEFVIGSARAEQNDAQLHKQLREARRASFLAAGAAILAFVATIVAAVIQG